MAYQANFIRPFGVKSDSYSMKIFYEDIYNQSEMSSSQKLSVISLVYKKGEKNYLSSYRPISLTQIKK